MNGSPAQEKIEQVIARKQDNYNASNDLARIKEEKESCSILSSSHKNGAGYLLSNRNGGCNYNHDVAPCEACFHFVQNVEINNQRKLSSQSANNLVKNREAKDKVYGDMKRVKEAVKNELQQFKSANNQSEEGHDSSNLESMGVK